MALVIPNVMIIQNTYKPIYKKFLLIAGSVLRMAQVAWGEPTWVKGLHYYLTSNQYSVAIPSDFYLAFQQATDEDMPNPWDVTIILESWELQPGTIDELLLIDKRH